MGTIFTTVSDTVFHPKKNTTRNHKNGLVFFISAFLLI